MASNTKDKGEDMGATLDALLRMAFIAHEAAEAAKVLYRR